MISLLPLRSPRGALLIKTGLLVQLDLTDCVGGGTTIGDFKILITDNTTFKVTTFYFLSL